MPPETPGITSAIPISTPRRKSSAGLKIYAKPSSFKKIIDKFQSCFSEYSLVHTVSVISTMRYSLDTKPLLSRTWTRFRIANQMKSSYSLVWSSHLPLTLRAILFSWAKLEALPPPLLRLDFWLDCDFLENPCSWELASQHLVMWRKYFVINSLHNIY